MSGQRKKPISTKNIYIYYKLSLVPILTTKATKCLILLVHINTHVGCIKEKIYMIEVMTLLSFSHLMYV